MSLVTAVLCIYTINTDVISYYSPVYILYYTQLILMLLVTTVLCINYIIHN